MFDFLTPVLTTGIVFLSIYRILELYARRKERMLMVEKMQDPSANKMNLPFLGTVRNPYGALRTSLLLIGIGIGFIVGMILDISLAEVSSCSNNDLISIGYMASVSIFGGIGLLISYLIERKKEQQ